MLLSVITISGVTIGAVKVYQDTKKERAKPWSTYAKKISQKNNKPTWAPRQKRGLLSLFDGNQKAAISTISANPNIALNQSHAQTSVPSYSDQSQELSDLLAKFLRKVEEQNERIKLLWQQANRWAIEKVQRQESLVSSDQASIKTLFRYVWSYIRPYWREMLFMAPCLLAFPLFSTYIALSLKYILDSALIGNLVPAFGAALVGFVAMTGIRILGEQLIWDLMARIGVDIRRDMFTQLQDLSPSFYQDNHTGDLITRFSTDTRALTASIQQVIRGSSVALSLLINFPLLFLLEWHLALLTVISLPTMLFLTKRLLAYASSTSYEAEKVNGQLAHILQENIKGQAIVRGLSMKKWRADIFNEKLGLFYEKTSQASFLEGLVRVAYQTSTLLTELFIYGSGALFVIAGSLPISSLIAFIAIFSEVKKNVYLLSNQFSQIISHTGSVRRLDELFQEVPEVTDVVDAIELPAFSQALRFEDVSFAYTEQQTVLNRVNLTIPFGQHVAFVGSSGAGKSTILNLILRFYDVTEGRVTIDGMDIRQVSQASLRRQMSVVLQEPFLFDTTIYENIWVSKPDATTEEVEAAAKAAEIHDFIVTLPEGYQTKVGEAGGRLSGGQRQRVSIARALLRQPAILILDEPTASLDAETTADISKTLETISKEHTVISVTHLLSSIVNADQIFVIDAGQVAERGTHEQLLAQQGVYHQLWHKQQVHEESVADIEAQQVEKSHIQEEFVALQARYDELLQKKSSNNAADVNNTNKTVGNGMLSALA